MQHHAVFGFSVAFFMFVICGLVLYHRAPLELLVAQQDGIPAGVYVFVVIMPNRLMSVVTGREGSTS